MTVLRKSIGPDFTDGKVSTDDRICALLAFLKGRKMSEKEKHEERAFVINEDIKERQ